MEAAVGCGGERGPVVGGVSWRRKKWHGFTTPGWLVGLGWQLAKLSDPGSCHPARGRGSRPEPSGASSKKRGAPRNFGDGKPIWAGGWDKQPGLLAQAPGGHFAGAAEGQASADWWPAGDLPRQSSPPYRSLAMKIKPRRRRQATVSANGQRARAFPSPSFLARFRSPATPVSVEGRVVAGGLAGCPTKLQAGREPLPRGWRGARQGGR